MSVLIKDMKMPTSCIECPCSLNLFFCKVYNGMPILDASSLTINGTTINVKRPDWCPLVELPEYHGRLVDANYLEEHADEWLSTYNLIDSAPTIIEADGDE